MSTSDSPRPALVRRLRAWGDRLRRSDVLLGVAVTAFALCVHWVRLEPIECGGDALNKWHFVRQWFHPFDVTAVAWNHHLTRLGVNVPTGFVQALLGRRAPVYHFASLAASTLAAVLLYVAGVMAHGRAAGLLAAIWLVLFPSWVRAATQLSPDTFGAAWALASLVALLAYGRARRHRTAWLVLSAFGAAGAYLAKEPLVFFIPGALAGVYLLRKSVRDVALYAAVPLGVFVLESLFYRSVSPYSSRLAIVSASHGKNPALTRKYLEIHSVWDALGRFTNLPEFYYPLFIAALVALVSLPWLSRDARLRAVLAYPASFFFFYTFAFRHLHPLTLWTRFLPRYLDPGVPFCALAATLLLTTGVGRLLARFPPPAALVARANALGPWAGGLLLFAIAASVWAEDPPGPHHAYLETLRLERVLTDAYHRGIPILSRGGGHDGYRALKAAYSVYIDDGEELRADGSLPRYADAYASNDRMVRPGSPSMPGHCAVRVWMHGRFLGVSPREPLGPECH